MTSIRIHDLANSCGVSSAPPLPPTELISFVLKADASVEVELASGETITSVAPGDLAGDHATSAWALVRALCSFTPGRLETGRRYVRRQIDIGDNKRGVFFIEAGR